MSTAAASSGGGGQSTGGGGQSTGGGAFNWGDGWRTQMAAGMSSAGTADPAELKRLERFVEPPQVYKSFREFERRMSAGELRSTLKKDATDPEIAAWRAENGIPAKPEEYKVDIPAAQAPKEDDAFLKGFLASAHANNFTQAQVDGAIGAFYSEVDRQAETITAAEKAAVDKTEDTLRQTWGADYRPNKAMAEALLTRAPAGFRDRFLNGYLADHTPIKASVEAWNWLVQMEREINPAATVLPGNTGDAGKSISQELIGLKKLMGDKNSAYWKGPEAEKNQQRYRDLVAADQKLKERAA